MCCREDQRMYQTCGPRRGNSYATDSEFDEDDNKKCAGFDAVGTKWSSTRPCGVEKINILGQTMSCTTGGTNTTLRIAAAKHSLNAMRLHLTRAKGPGERRFRTRCREARHREARRRRDEMQRVRRAMAGQSSNIHKGHDKTWHEFVKRCSRRVQISPDAWHQRGFGEQCLDNNARNENIDDGDDAAWAATTRRRH